MLVSSSDEPDLDRQLRAACHSGGRKLKSASPAAAMEIVMVRT